MTSLETEAGGSERDAAAGAARIGVLTNLSAGGRNRSGHAVAHEAGRHEDLLHCETAGSAMVPDAVAAFADQGVDLLVVNGGDGTLQRALTEVLGSCPGWRPRIAPLRSGRTNMAALDLGASRDPSLALQHLIADAREGRLAARLAPRAVLRLDRVGEDAPHFGMFFGAGTVCRAIELTHKSFPKGRAQGVFGSALVTGTLLARLARGRHDGLLAPDKVEIALDGEQMPSDAYTAVLATTLDRLFLRLRPFWGRGPGAVRLTTLAAGSQGLARALPRVLRGQTPPDSAEGIASHNADEIRFRLDCDISLDGELFGPRPDRVVRLTAPERVDFLRA